MKHKKPEKSNMHVAWRSLVDETEARIRLVKETMRASFKRLRSLRLAQRRLRQLQARAALLYELREMSKEVARVRWAKRAATPRDAEVVRKVPRRAEAARR